MAKRRPSEPTPDDALDYLLEWAGRLVEALPPDEVRGLIREYAAISRDSTQADGDRAFARKRAKSLRSALKRKP